jgi:hypothetical protein
MSGRKNGTIMRITFELCLMYCVEWNTLNASPFRKSREDSKPITGLKVQPVQSTSNKLQAASSLAQHAKDLLETLRHLLAEECCRDGSRSFESTMEIHIGALYRHASRTVE